MVKITLEPARNGIIKRTFDDNHGGSTEEWLSSDVYEQIENNKLEHIITFFNDLCDDLGLDLGNSFDKEVISIKKEWGSNYKPNDIEINEKIKELEDYLQLLKTWKTF